MFARQKLTSLSNRKAAIRLGIDVGRGQCVAAAAGLSQPLRPIGRACAVWREVVPFARLFSLPLAVAATHALFPKSKALRTIVRWGPLVIAFARAVDAGIRSSAGTRRGDGA